jgi:hypothetical protein
MDGNADRKQRAPFVPLVIILTLALGLRLAPVFCRGAYPVLFLDPDSCEYHRLACNLVAGNGYSWDESPPYTPNLYRTPGLPALLAALYSLAGPSVPLAIVLQAVVSAASVLMTYLLTRALAARQSLALAAAAVQALDPVAIQYSNILLTETFTCLLVLLAAVCLCRFVARGGPGWMLVAGAVLAVGILFHPVLLFAPLLFPAVPFLRGPERDRRDVAVACAAVLIALAPAGLWMWRNHDVGDFTGISSVTAVNLLKYKAAGVEAELRGTTRAVERDRLTAECEAELPADATAGHRLRSWQRRGMAILLRHPILYAQVHLRGMALELFGPERDHTTRLLYGPAVLDEDGAYTDASTAAARETRPVATLEVARHAILAWQGVLLLGAVTGAIVLARRKPGLLAVLLVVPLYVLMLSGGPEASPRFRVLYLPAISLLTAVGYQAVGQCVRHLRWRQAESVNCSSPTELRGASRACDRGVLAPGP